MGVRVLGLVGLVLVLGLAGLVEGQEKNMKVYEMRTYYAPEGKLDALLARFRNHTVKLFEKHGMTNVGYWVPVDNPDHKLIYILAYPSRAAREESWNAFQADPAWKVVRKETEADGKIVNKVDSVFLEATDYSPTIKPSKDGDRVFELRTYTASPGKLADLNARFRNHTVKLFEKHGMTNIGYWTPLAGQPGADNTLIYILAHKSVDAAKAGFDGFRKDPAWIEARKASEVNGSLTVKDGVKSVFMTATDFSPIR